MRAGGMTGAALLVLLMGLAGPVSGFQPGTAGWLPLRGIVSRGTSCKSQARIATQLPSIRPPVGPEAAGWSCGIRGWGVGEILTQRVTTEMRAKGGASRSGGSSRRARSGFDITKYLDEHVEHKRGRGNPPTKPLQLVEEEAVAIMGDLRARDLSTIMNKYAKIGTQPGTAMLEAMERHGVAKIDEYDAQTVAISLHAYGKLGPLGLRPGKAMLAELEKRGVAIIGSFIPQSLANSLWACAKLAKCGVRCSLRFIQALEDKSVAEMPGFKPQDVANTMWAYATLGEAPGQELLEGLKRQALARMAGFNAQNVANTMWAYATLGKAPGRELLEGLARQALARMAGFNAQNVANTMWAYATLGETPGQELLEGLERRAIAGMPKFNAQEVANTMWAYAKLRRAPGRELLDGLRRQAVARMADFNAQEVANTMWAYATLGEAPGRELLEGLERQAVARMSGFNAQEVANTMWAYATFGLAPGLELLASLASRTLVHLKSGSFNTESVCQVHVFLVFLQLEASVAYKSIEELCSLVDEFGDAGRQAMANEPVTVSDLQRQVSAAVRRLGYEFEEEAKDSVSGYSIDLLIKPSGYSVDLSTGEKRRGVAVEVDGPMHFLTDSRQPTGSTMLKRRLLEKLGYCVVSVPFWEWDCRKKGQQDAYLRQLLQDAL